MAIITGTIDDDNLLGSALNDTISGDLGNDTIDGSKGNDRLIGGEGNDTYYVDTSYDVIIENPSEGIDTIYSTISWALGKNIENIVLTGTSNINVAGNELYNSLTGNSGNNNINGSTGIDTLSGLSGNDTLNGGTGDDSLIGGAGNDIYYVDNSEDKTIENPDEGIDLVYSSVTYTLLSDLDNLVLTGTSAINADGNSKNNTITGNTGNNILNGQDGNDSINGGLGADTLYGGNGNDTLNGSTGIDSMCGGIGDDVYFVDNSSDKIYEDTEEGIDAVQTSVNYTLTTNVENLTLIGANNINGYGNNSNNTIEGNLANNILDGSSGDDTLIGKIGNDTYVVDANDLIIENIGQGVDSVNSYISYSLGLNIENLTLLSTSNLDGTGNIASNRISGNIGDNTLRGNLGNDSLFGNDGNDTIYGEADNDIIDGGIGADSLIGGSGNDIYYIDDALDKVIEEVNDGVDLVYSYITYTIEDNTENLTLTGSSTINGYGNGLNNTLIGNSYNNILNGGLGNDTICSGYGNDTLDDDLGTNILYGGFGDDTYYVENTSNTIIEYSGQGYDKIISTISYTLINNVENLTLADSLDIIGTGNTLNNTIIGNNGNNSLYGLSGNDTLKGLAGDDYLEGGFGYDTYLFGLGDGQDIVNDTLSGSIIKFGDSIWLDDLSFDKLDSSLFNLTLGINNTLDNITINNFYNGISCAGSKIILADGLSISRDLYPTLTMGSDNAEAIDNLPELSGSNIIYAGSGDDTVNGLVGNDIVNGEEGNDLIYGDVGNDILIGGADSDSLYGGVGNDSYYIDANDLIVESYNSGIDNVYTRESYTLKENFENLILIGTSAISGLGNVYNNILTGNLADNILDGGTGIDKLIGGDGNDTYYSDNSSDSILENLNQGIDTVYSRVTYTLSNNTEILILSDSNNINGYGNTGNNTIIGNSGNNTLDGKGGIDSLLGGAGNDTYIVDNSSDIIVDSSGVDIARASANYTLADNITALIMLGTAITGSGNSQANTVIGNAYGNVLYGLSGDDTINGSTGVDSLYGGSGNDSYYVDNYGDQVYEESGDGIDIIYAASSFTLKPNVENMTLTGSSGINGYGNELNNTITGNSGNNILNGGSGADYLAGGLGSDTYYVDNSGDILVENSGQGTDTVITSISYSLLANFENLTLAGEENNTATGNSYNNVLKGNIGNNILYGYEGNDTLDGGIGTDTMYGGLGNDAYYIDNCNDLMVENSSEGIDLIYSTVSYTLKSNVENMILTGSSGINGYGNELNNTITGNTGNNILDGGAGNDKLIGGLGNDTYIIEGNDIVVENSSQGNDTVRSSLSYILGANLENLILIGNENINGQGNTLNNAIYGNNANNTLNGDKGIDSLYGGLGNDIYIVDNTADKTFEDLDQGIDTVNSSITYTLMANVENLTLTGTSHINGTGNQGNNSLTGNKGNNILSGDLGNDTIDGGMGVDSMYGGDGNDIYYVDRANDATFESANEGTDTVYSSISYVLSSGVENLILQNTAGGNIVTNPTGNQVIVFGESNIWKDYLDYKQGDNSQGYLGCCGIISCENVLIQMGVLEKKIGYVPSYGSIDALETSIIGTAISNNFCVKTGSATQLGGTSQYSQEKILEKYGIAATPQFATVEILADAVKNNKGVIVEVAARRLWNASYIRDEINHAVTLTGIAYDINNPSKIDGFYLCDSGRGLKSDSERYVSYDTMKSIFYFYGGQGLAVITDNPAKLQLVNTTGTGNDLNNTITGSNGNNTLNGLGGNDTLDGGLGNDTLYGGTENDTYLFKNGDNTDIINDASGSADTILLAEDVAKENIAVFYNNNDLVINYNDNEITVQNQKIVDNAIEKIQLNNGLFITNAEVNQIIDNMSSYAVANGLEFTSVDSIKANQTLWNMVINSWHA